MARSSATITRDHLGRPIVPCGCGFEIAVPGACMNCGATLHNESSTDDDGVSLLLNAAREMGAVA